MLENSTGSRLCVAKVWDDLKRAENYQIDPGLLVVTTKVTTGGAC